MHIIIIIISICIIVVIIIIVIHVLILSKHTFLTVDGITQPKLLKVKPGKSSRKVLNA